MAGVWRLAVGSKVGILLAASLSLALAIPPATFAISKSSSASEVLKDQGRNEQQALDAFHSLDGHFIENRGQVADGIRFYSTGNPSVAFSNDGVLFVLKEKGAGKENAERTGGASASFMTPASTERPARRSFAYLVRFGGANDVAPVGRGELPFKSNFFIGSNSSGWRTDVPNYREVVYDELYDGISLVYRGGSSGVKYEFVVRPGSDPGDIRLAFDGVESPHIGEGRMIVSTPLGEITDSVPYSYQEDGREVGCAFAARGDGLYGFDCGARDQSKLLVIDPLVYSTFLGGSDDNNYCGIAQGDRGYSIAVDAAGSAYVYGLTCSTDFPVTPGAYNTTYWIKGVPHFVVLPPCSNIDWCVDPVQTFVAKLNPQGTMLVYATYLGGTSQEFPGSIAVDSAGNAYLTGSTMSAGLQPGSSAYPVTLGSFDTSFDVFHLNTTEWCFSVFFTEAFVTKLNPQGNGLVYSTFLGGNGYEVGWGIALDSTGNAYVAGETNGTDFPTTAGALDRTFNSNYGTWDYPDIFVSKLSADGSALAYSTYVGGSGYEWARSISVDSSGNAYITGETNSTNFPVTAAAFDTTLSGTIDGFVLKLDSTGKNLDYSTLIGGNQWELSYSIAVDSDRNAYVTGTTESADFPVTPGAFHTSLRGARDAFITKLNPTGTGLVYSTFLGGNSDIDSAVSIALDSLDHAFVTGYTYSGDFPITKDAFDTVFDTREGFLTELNTSGTGLLYSTFIGGHNPDQQGTSVVTDSFGIAYVTGWTNASDFPTTPGAFSRTLDNLTDAFVVKLNPVTAADLPDLAIVPLDISFTPPSPVMISGLVTIDANVHNIGGANASSVLVRFHDGPPPTNQIGTDQVIPSVPRFFGTGRTSVVWTAASLGIHSICVVTDPDNSVIEKREDNNQACAPIEVVPQMPDLEVTSSDVILFPPSPFVEGTDVQVNATIRNSGASASGATFARFHDGIPPSPTIGTDQPVGPLAVGGSATVSVTWRASPPGLHRICVVVDPGNLVVEINETNNQACVNASVRALPDVAPTLIATAPVPPLLEGIRIWLNVTVANIGGTPAGTFDVLLFHDSNGNRLPDVGEQIGLSSVAILMSGSLTVVPFVWTASPAGTLSICANADPSPGNVTESNEMNNVKCIDVVVKPIPVTRPDYVPALPEPPPPIRVGLSLPVSLSIVVHNQGNATASNDSILAFYNESSPADPFVSFMVSPISPGENSSRFAATWTSPAFPGTYNVAADIDHANNVTEWDETNNLYTWTIEVMSGPVTSLVIGAPNYTSTATYVTSSTPLSLSVIDQGGSGINYTKYRIDNFTWIDYSGTPFILAGEKDHYVEYYSEDNVGNVEDVSHKVLRVDDTPPATSLSIGDPKHLVGGNFTTSSTPIVLQATDGGVIPAGVGLTRYRIDGGDWKDYSSSFTLTGEKDHSVEYYSRDLLTNEEAVRTIQIVVDDASPATTMSIGAPKHLVGGNFTTSSTPLTLHADDEGNPPVGTNSTFYRLWNGSWSSWREHTSSFTLIGRDETWFVEFLSFDFLGNREAVRNVTVVLDNTPPSLSIYPESSTVLVDTPFTISADDGQGSGVASIEYRTDGGDWTPYSSSFVLSMGHHLVEYRSSDNLNNSGERSLSVDVVGSEALPKVEVDYKPLIALIFSIVLLVAGTCSSKKRPWKGGKNRKAVAKAFVFTSLPFVLIEAVTGVFSLSFEPLRIPPLVGWGTVVDCSILAAGLLFSLIRMGLRKRTKPQGSNADKQSG